MAYILLLLVLLGLLGLWVGSELAIQGMRNLANYFKISGLFIGLTVASIGTSIPELAVSITGAFDRLAGVESSGIVIGNAVGSAIALITLIIGILAFRGFLKIDKRELTRDGFALLASVAIFYLLAADGFLSVTDGLLMILIYAFYFYNLVREERVYEKVRGRRAKIHIFTDLLFLSAGIFIVIQSAQAVLTNSVSLAQIWGINETIIGIFILGIGTGLPELTISLQALAKKEIGLSIGNMLGSNLVDLLLSVGIGASISGFLSKGGVLKYDLPVLFGVILLMLFLFRTKFKMSKREGSVLIIAYLAYAVFRLFPLLS